MESSEALKRAIDAGNDDLVYEALEVLIKESGLDRPAIWADSCLRLMAGALRKEIGWPVMIANHAVLDSIDNRIRSAIDLAAMLSKYAGPKIRKEAPANWTKPFELLGWADRLDVLTGLLLYVDIEDPAVMPQMCHAVSSFIGAPENDFEVGQHVVDVLSFDGRLETHEKALDAYVNGELFTEAVRRKDEHVFLRGLVAEFADSSDRQNFERAFDACVRFELGLGEFDRAAKTAGEYGGRLRVKAALVKAIAVAGAAEREGNLKAATYLLDEFDACHPEVTDRGLLLKEASIYAGKNPDLVAEIKRRDVSSEGETKRQFAGRILIVGGGGDMKTKLKRAFAKEDCDSLTLEHMTSDAAKNQGPRLRQLVAGSDGVLIYWWVSSHAASEKAKLEAEAAGVKYMYSSFPGCAGFVSDVAELLDR